jgi:hypothetical protein
VTSGQRERIGQLLEEMEARAGPIPPELLDEARQVGQAPEPAREACGHTGEADEEN